MEFDEMKKIWDAQSNQALYAIDEEALHKRVLKKKERAAKIASRSELIMIRALLISFSIIMGASIFKSKYDLVPLVLAAVMLVMAFLIFMRRRKRLAWQNTFDQSILGDMEEAIANAEYQVRFSHMGKWIYVVVAVLSVAALVDTIEEWWKGALVSLFFIVGFFAAKWEHQTFYVSQKRNLEAMRDKLEDLQNEEPQTTDFDQYI